MDVGVVLAVVLVDGVDDDLRLLTRRRRVEIHQRPSVNRGREDREVPAHPVRVERAGSTDRRAGGLRGVLDDGHRSPPA
jgi:hypothetical protein